MHRLRGAIALAVMAFAAYAAASRAQTFEGTAEVLEVVVPVHVVASDGNPVRGLTAADFELLDEGRSRPITHFEVVDLDLLSGEGVPGEGGRDELPATARRHILFLFDLSFADPTSIQRAREAARQFAVESLHATDLAAVASFSLETGPHLVLTFTPDRLQLARAIDNLGLSRVVRRGFELDPLRFIVEPLTGAGQASSTTSAGAGGNTQLGGNSVALLDHFSIVDRTIERGEKGYERGLVTAWSSGLGELARALNGVAGRKHVLYFSEGFDSRLLFGRQPDTQDSRQLADDLALLTGSPWLVDSDDRFGSSPLQQTVTRMLGEFQRADVAIQAVDIGGLRAAQIAERPRDVGQEALFYVANETGGELLEDANDLGRQLDRLLARSSVTYLLTFQPAGVEPDGAFHRLKVKLRSGAARGARLSYRRGYYAPRPFRDLPALEKRLLAADAIAAAAPRNEVDLQVLAAAFRAGPETSYVPVIAEVGGDDLLLAHQDGELGVELYGYATNERGEVRDFFSQMITLDLAAVGKSLRRGGLKYYGHLDLEPGRYLVRVLVRNAGTGRTGVRSVRVAVPTHEDTAPVLLPPFFLEEPGRWILVRERQDDAYRESVVYPFTVKGEPYVPAARPSLRPRQTVQLCLVAYNLTPGELHLGGQVVADDGERRSAELRLVERTVTGREALDKLLATFRPAGLDPGSYTLEVAVTDPRQGITQTESLPFRIN